jgi:hypothetical protein
LWTYVVALSITGVSKGGSGSTLVVDSKENFEATSFTVTSSLTKEGLERADLVYDLIAQ